MKLSKSLRRAATAVLVSATAMAYASAALAIEPGTLIVAHDTDPDDATLFTYMVDGQTPGGAGLDDDPVLINGYDNVINTKTFAVTPGDYTVSQGDPGPGWSLDAIKCNGPTPAYADLANRKISLNVAPGTEITCRFYNKRISAPPTGKVVIQKLVNPTHAQDFNFQGTGGPGNWNQSFQLDDDIGASGADNLLPKTRAFDVPPGNYTFKETPTNGWTLTKIECSPAANGSVNLNGHSAQINVVAGQTTTCYFTNTQNNAEIRIIKDAMPNSTKDFGFTGGGPNFAQAIILDDDAGVAGADNQRQNSQAFIIPAGQYAFTEAQVNGWVLTGITCTPSAAAVIDQPGRKATINVSAGQSVTCTYRNKPIPVPPCTGYPLNQTVNFVSLPPSWGPQTVHICRGGTVTFKNVGFNSTHTVAPSTPAGSFTPVPLAAGNSQGTTTPFQTAGTFKYWWAPTAPQGTIIVH